MSSNADISDSLQQLLGRPAWGLHRSHGSMFLFDVGEPLPQTGKRVHGEWNFLFETCMWRFEGDGVYVTSEDDSATIENQFMNMTLGHVTGASFSVDSQSLSLTFDSGKTLTVDPEPSENDSESTEWIFFIPGALCWSKTKSSLSIGTIYGPSLHN